MKVFWRCPCGEVIYLDDALKENDAVDEATGQLEGLNHDKGFLLTNILCDKCKRALIINFDVSRKETKITDHEGRDVFLPEPED